MAIESMLSRMKSAGDTTRVIRESRNEAMRVILEVLQGSRKGRSFMFDRHDTFIVGRSRFVHCSMPEDMALSRDHFMLEINPPQCELRDLGSTNGTFVNNQRVERIRLASGDMIAAGQSVFRVKVDQSPLSSSEASSPSSSSSRSDGGRSGCHKVRRLPHTGTSEYHDRRADPGRSHRGCRMVVLAMPFRGGGLAPAGAALHDFA